MTADEIRALRVRLGLSQREMADRINAVDPAMRASGTTVSRWETGQRKPSAHSEAALRRVAAKGERSS